MEALTIGATNLLGKRVEVRLAGLRVISCKEQMVQTLVH
jgi:hypothetical protein